MLAGVMDPELHASIVGPRHGRRRRRSTPNGDVVVNIALTTLGCPLRAEIKKEVQSKVRGLPGVAEVDVHYVEMTQEQRTAAMQAARWNAHENAPTTEISATTAVLAIASGKGGVGKSSVTVNLAAALAARGLRVGILDADIWGFSVPRMLGVEGRLARRGRQDPPEHARGAGRRRRRSRSCRWASSSTTRAPRSCGAA